MEERSSHNESTEKKDERVSADKKVEREEEIFYRT